MKKLGLAARKKLTLHFWGIGRSVQTDKMASTVVLARNFSTSKVSFAQVRTLDSGGKQAYVNYDGGKFLFQTPALGLPYGMSTYDKAGPIKYSVEMSLRGYDESGSKSHELYNALHALDEFMVEQGVKNSKAWFKADLKPDVVRAFYTPIIKWSKDKEGNVKPYPPGIKVTLRKNGDAFEVKMYDANKEEYHGVPVEDLLVKGAVIRCVMQCTGVWFAGGKYGLSWKAAQIVMDKVPESVRGFAFVEDDDEAMAEDDAAFSAPAAAPPARSSVVAAVLPTPEPQQQQQQQEEDLDDEAEDAEPIPVPKKVAPVAAVKKRVVAAVKK